MTVQSLSLSFYSLLSKVAGVSVASVFIINVAGDTETDSGFLRQDRQMFSHLHATNELDLAE